MHSCVSDMQASCIACICRQGISLICQISLLDIQLSPLPSIYVGDPELQKKDSWRLEDIVRDIIHLYRPSSIQLLLAYLLLFITLRQLYILCFDWSDGHIFGQTSLMVYVFCIHTLLVCTWITFQLLVLALHIMIYQILWSLDILYVILRRLLLT